MKTTNPHIRSIRRLTAFFIIALAFSGITAFPLLQEMTFLAAHDSFLPLAWQHWIDEVAVSLSNTDAKILYGTDWLAFAHLVIASFFIGVYKDPVKNRFIVQIGIFACIAILPTAFVCGAVRAIPFFHQLIDCSFGIIGMVPLLLIDKKINQLERLQTQALKLAA